MSDHVNRFGAKAASALMGLCAIGVLIMMLAIVVQVLASRAGMTTVSALSTPWPLFRDEITLNSLTDLQWYLLAAIALLPAGVVWLRSEHVRVDFIYSQLKPRGKIAVDLLGHLLFALLALVFLIPDAWDLTVTAFGRGEKSANGGLTDRYLARGGSTCRSKPATSGDRVRVLLPDSTMALSQWLSMALPS